MITQLTKQQESKLSVYRDKWINKMLNPKKIDLAEMIKQNNIMYEFCGLSKPLTLVARSPFEAQIMANIVKKDQVRDQVRDQVENQVGYQVWDQVENQVKNHVWDQVGDQVGNHVLGQVKDQVGDQVEDQVKNHVLGQVKDQVWDQVWDHVEDQVRYQVWDQVGNQVWDQVGDQVKDQVKDHVEDQVKNHVLGQVKDQVWDQVGDHVEDQVWDQVGNQVGYQVWDQVEDQVEDQVRNQVRDQVEDQVEDQVKNQDWDQVRNQVWDQVEDQVKNQVRDQVEDQVEDQVGDQVWDQVGYQVWDQVGDHVGNHVLGQVKDQVGDIKHYYFSSYLNYSDYGWLSSYDFFNSELQCFNEKLKEKLEMIIDYINAGVFMSIQLRGLCIVCPFPTYIKRNNNNDLHCEDGHCLEFEDGYKMYCLDGIRFDRKGQEELYWKIVKHKLTLPEILAIEDIDQRAIALKYCNAKSIIDDLEKSGQAELIDEATKQASYLEHDSVEFINGIAQIDFTVEKPKEIKKLLSYKLYKVIIPNIFDEPEYMLVYPHASVDGLSYWKGVDPETAKKGSIASIAKYHNMSVDEYLLATSQS